MGSRARRLGHRARGGVYSKFAGHRRRSWYTYACRPDRAGPTSQPARWGTGGERSGAADFRRAAGHRLDTSRRAPVGCCRRQAQAAPAVVPPGLEVPDRMLVMGVPAKIVRPLREHDFQYMRWLTDHYVELAQRYVKGVFGGEKREDRG